MNTKEFAKLCGVEKRTLFHYDELGILKPAFVRENGYREYRPEQIGRMDMIKLLQASGYTLREIDKILCADAKERQKLFFAAQKLIDDKIAIFLDMKYYISRKEQLLYEYLNAVKAGEKYKIQHICLTYSAKQIKENSHFFSFLSDKSYDSAILDGEEKMFAYKDDPYGIKKEGRAISFFLEISIEVDMLSAIKDELDKFPFEGEDVYYVSILPELLVEKKESVILKVIIFEQI